MSLIFPSAGSPILAPFGSDEGGVAEEMMLRFIEPQEAVRVIAESVGREARRDLLAAVIQAWVDDIPEGELAHHYSRAVTELGHDDLSMLAAWHATLEVGQPVASPEFLVGAFSGLGPHKRDALKL